jgi:hypothetical protein
MVDEPRIGLPAPEGHVLRASITISVLKLLAIDQPTTLLE